MLCITVNMLLNVFHTYSLGDVSMSYIFAAKLCVNCKSLNSVRLYKFMVMFRNECFKKASKTR